MTSTEQFIKLPEAQRLIAIARSDNALIALDVQRREVSWTKFMAWFLDPARNTRAVAAERLQALLRAAGAFLGEEVVTSIEQVSPEHVAGSAGRLDVLIRCRTNAQGLLVLVENKIDASEHEEQLADYVAHFGEQRAAGEVLVPILIELGDNPARTATYADAACLDRSAIRAWLADLSNPPAIVRDYLTLFEAWDIAAELRRQHFDTIQAIGESDTQPTEWSLLRDWLVSNELPFYEQVLEQPGLKRVLLQHGLVPDMHGRMKSDGAHLKLGKEMWRLWPCGEDEKGIEVHFECMGRGKLQLDIEIYPYKGGIAKNPKLLAALAPQLEVKADLHRRMRPRLAALDAGFEVIQKSLSRPDNPAANSAGRFDGGLSEDCSPEEHARFMAEVIKVVAPVVGEVLGFAQ